ncbi:MAG: S-methyl-5-thioribose-1-phosphate isomerase [Candidatus Aenigmarchaeota archaeon]|nr:S-methyl-5-thioribose-1-phosphate isomerase [Candidatus Aenigmarchaeota archaeon]
MESLDKVVETIKSVKVQGAKEIAIYALKFLKEFCRKNGFQLKFEVAAMILERARPTAVVLYNCLELLMKKRSIKTIDALLKRLELSTEKIARNGSKLIRKNHKIMTHCHSGEAMAVITHSWKQGKNISVIATETEPLEQGIKTAKELAKEKIPVTLITDNAIEHFMKDADIVLVGSDSLRKEGTINKIGTSLLALSAKHHRKPFYVAANTLKLDKRKKFVIEERPSREVYKNIDGVRIRNPAFDVTSWKFVTSVITENGIKKPGQIVRMIK